MHRAGVGPLQIERLDPGQSFRRFAFIENGVQLAFPDRIEHFAVQIAQHSFSLLILVSFGLAGTIRDGPLADAPALDKNLRLQQLLALACLALHVVDGVVVPNIRVETEDHAVQPFLGPAMLPVLN